jgi:hypothetical protein
MSSQGKNQGEGDREAARRFNRKSEEFAHSRKGKNAIEEGAELSEEEAREARRKEREGLQRAKEEDPQVVRDYTRGET